jgi:cell division protein ZipA
MIERDTIILALGLLIVGTFARGLIVAVRVRRNQLRFALGKSISDIENPDEINLEELPQGGARVVLKNDPDEELMDEKRSSARFSTVADGHELFDECENQLTQNSDFNKQKDHFVSTDEADGVSESTKKESGLRSFSKDSESDFEFDFEASSDISGSIKNNDRNVPEDIEVDFSVSIEDRIGFTQTPDRASKIPAAASEIAEQSKSFFSRLRKQKVDDSDFNKDDLLFSEYTNADEHLGAGSSATEDSHRFYSTPDEKLTTGPAEEVSYIQEKSLLKNSSEILVINVMAKEGRLIRGGELLLFFETHSLCYGDMNIFHKYVDNDFKNPSIFRVVNMLNPGTFDLEKMDEFTTFGVSFFLSLPSCMNNFDAFEYMLLTAKNLQESLGAEFKDDQRNAMTEQTIEHYRQRVRDFELASLRASGNNE